ncbi:MAG: peptide chain release factor N(5)-glutamine methyltransferase [Dehalococcoidia bacterium]|nr:peptide chain release factor N(5)-glutamine methyltransferase [Dehalococcoidia bacterium]
MKVGQAWKDASAKLAAGGIEDALMEGELLLRQTLKMERSEFYSGLSGELTTSELNRLKEFLTQRLTHKPSAYIRHVKEFYGLEFYVDERVLIPRPETELLVEKALEMVHSRLTLRQAQGGEGLLIADIGTGSGAIAVALAVNLPRFRIFATDISGEALEVAEINCRKHGVADRVQLLSGDLLTPLPQPVDIIIANLPYIPDAELDNLAPEVSRYEPSLALSGGPDGLEYIRRLIDQGTAKLKPGGALLLEVGMGQAEVVAGMVHRYFLDVTVYSDLAGIPRVVVGKGVVVSNRLF